MPAPAPATSPAPAPAVAAASAPLAGPAAVKPPAAAAGGEASFLDSLADNPLLLPGAGALAIALLGFGLYRYKNRETKDRTETSFLESRVQPDSFFGASGGQRVDTSDASAGSSSMGFSLSQLDAIGDVDPVAEADVYLAYGRDLQAEEILKEAMRTNPDRMAVRTKLLEVYAKRRDTKGFELLAVQLFALTKGSGTDWEKAQTMGRQIDPENPLYQVGGHPANLLRDGDKEFVEPLGATTLPASSIPHGRSDFQSSDLSGATPSGFVDLDLDLGAPSPSPSAMETTRPLATSAENMPPLDLGFAAPPMPKAAPVPTPAPAAAPMTMDFDLDDLSLDLPTSPTPSPASSHGAPAAALDNTLDFGDFELSTKGALAGPSTTPDDTLPPDSADPIARKLELAEEFRQIGDTEGARDLLEEVVAKSSGALKAKAQGMLDELG
jgi:pilus assembly protein FimV